MGLSDMLIDTEERLTDNRQIGLARGVVVEVVDTLMNGRVKVRIPSLPGIEMWAPVCAPFAGRGYGLWCMPQVDDVVMVAFENGDPTLPYIVGSVWQLGDAPVDQALDAITKRVFKTPGGHALVFDDLLQKISLTHALGHELVLGADEITISLSGGMASLTLKIDGSATLQAKRSMDVSAAQTTVKGDVTLDLEAITTSVKGDATLRVNGGLVTIN